MAGSQAKEKGREVRHLLFRVEFAVGLFERVKHGAVADNSKKQLPALGVVGEGSKADKRVLEDREALKGWNKAGEHGGGGEGSGQRN